MSKMSPLHFVLKHPLFYSQTERPSSMPVLNLLSWINHLLMEMKMKLNRRGLHMDYVFECVVKAHNYLCEHILKNSSTENNEGFSILLTAVMEVSLSRLPQEDQRHNLFNTLIFQHNYWMYCVCSYLPPCGASIQPHRILHTSATEPLYT